MEPIIAANDTPPPGGAFEHNDQRLERPRIAWEWDLGQWVLIASKRNLLWAWQSWYRMSTDRLQASETENRAAFIHGHSTQEDLTHGPESADRHHGDRALGAARDLPAAVRTDLRGERGPRAYLKLAGQKERACAGCGARWGRNFTTNKRSAWYGRE